MHVGNVYVGGVLLLAKHPGLCTLTRVDMLMLRMALKLRGGAFSLPTSEDLVIEDAELRSILSNIAKPRSAGGRAVSGRYIIQTTTEP